METANGSVISLQESVLDVHISEAGYEAGQSTIRNINIHVSPGELVGIIGPNGAGKSTTMKTMLGLLEHANYEVKIGGRDVTLIFRNSLCFTNI